MVFQDHILYETVGNKEQEMQVHKVITRLLVLYRNCAHGKQIKKNKKWCREFSYNITKESNLTLQNTLWTIFAFIISLCFPCYKKSSF